MLSRLGRLGLLSVVLTLVLVALPLGGRLSDRPAAQAASSGLALYGVACLSSSTCLAVGGFPGSSTYGSAGSNGTTVRSTDAGRTWRLGLRGGTPYALTGVACASPSSCVAVGDSGTLLRSTDGGSYWSSQPSGTTNHLTGVACQAPLPAPQHLLAVPRPMCRSADKY